MKKILLLLTAVFYQTSLSAEAFVNFDLGYGYSLNDSYEPTYSFGVGLEKRVSDGLSVGVTGNYQELSNDLGYSTFFSFYGLQLKFWLAELLYFAPHVGVNSYNARAVIIQFEKQTGLSYGGSLGFKARFSKKLAIGLEGRFTNFQVPQGNAANYAQGFLQISWLLLP